MNIGDQVRLIGIPASLPVGDADLSTKTVFEKCLGNVFTVVGFNAIGLAELPIEVVTGGGGETIWVEAEFLEVVSK
jgi:hypothetical protein